MLKKRFCKIQYLFSIESHEIYLALNKSKITIYRQFPNQKNPIFCRLNEALKKDEFKDVDEELAHEVFDVMHRMINTDTVAYSWYDSSCREYFEDCEGDEMLGWKDKGYGTVLELLQVFLPFFYFLPSL